MTNFLVSRWKGGTPEERYYVIDIRRAPELKMICETPTEGLAKLICALLNKNEDRS